MLSGREQVWRRVGEGHRGEAVQLPSRGHAKPPVPRVTGDGWKRLRTGVPCASCMIPLESRMRAIRTSGSEGRGWKRAYGHRATS